MPSIVDLRTACANYASSRNYDQSYASFRKATEGAPNLFLSEHRAALLSWLNSWGCRQFAKNCHDLASSEILEWYTLFHPILPDSSRNLIDLPETTLPDIQAAYDSLADRVASIRALRNGSLPTKVTVSETGASKILFAIRPHVFLPWDKAIRDKFFKNSQGTTYTDFLMDAKKTLIEIREECERKNLDFSALPFILGRPMSPIPKLLDEYNWATRMEEIGE